MKKVWILVAGVFVISLLAAVDMRMHLKTETAASLGQPASTIVTESSTADAAVDSAAAVTSTTDTAVNNASAMANTADADAVSTASTGSSVVDESVLIRNLDKTDEIIGPMYKESPENLVVGDLYDGNFTGSGKPELLVIFKMLNLPHAGGLDCSIAAVYDRATLDIITQRTFPYDECKFKAVEDEEQNSYLLFAGSTTYQGYTQGYMELWKPGRVWEELLQYGKVELRNRLYQLREDGSVGVFWAADLLSESGEVVWRHEYNLVWNKKTRKFDVSIPEEYRDEKGDPNVDTVSTSPDGKYAVSVIHDSYRVLLYDTETNKLSGNFELLAQDYGFLWSPDSTKVCVTKTARIWIESSVIDAKTKKVTELPPLYQAFQKKGARLGYTLNENRPDPYIRPVEWAPDNRRLLLFYEWTDSDYKRQNGTFVLDTESGAVSRIVQNAEAEGEHLTPEKPEGFQWK
jgi:hypothetical protein